MDGIAYLGAVIIGLILFILPAYIADKKGRNVFLFIVLSVVFWPLALLLAIVSEDYSKKEGFQRRRIFKKPEKARFDCPACGESIPVTANLCRFCKCAISDEVRPKMGRAAFKRRG
jgi:hypothetical protein